MGPLAGWPRGRQRRHGWRTPPTTMTAGEAGWPHNQLHDQLHDQLHNQLPLSSHHGAGSTRSGGRRSAIPGRPGHGRRDHVGLQRGGAAGAPGPPVRVPGLASPLQCEDSQQWNHPAPQWGIPATKFRWWSTSCRLPRSGRPGTGRRCRPRAGRSSRRHRLW